MVKKDLNSTFAEENDYYLASKNLNRLKVVLAEKQRTNKWLAEQLGKDQTTISKWCTNSSQLDLGNLMQIAKILDVELTDLVWFEEFKKRNKMKKKKYKHCSLSLNKCRVLNDVECWSARDLCSLLGYKLWQNFTKVIDKAKEACVNVGQSVEDHFIDVNKMVVIGSGAERQIDDIMLTRYACYLCRSKW